VKSKTNDPKSDEREMRRYFFIITSYNVCILRCTCTDCELFYTSKYFSIYYYYYYYYYFIVVFIYYVVQVLFILFHHFPTSTATTTTTTTTATISIILSNSIHQQNKTLFNLKDIIVPIIMFAAPTNPPAKFNNNIDDDKLEQEMTRILSAAGIHNQPIDPSSMEALKEMIRDREEQQDKKPSAAVGGTAAPPFQPSIVMSPPAAAAAAAGLKEPPPPPAVSTALAAASGPVGPNTNDNNAMMIQTLSQQIQYQTNLLLSVQRQITYLTNKVQQLEESSNNHRGAPLAGSPSSMSTTASDRSFNFARTKIYMGNGNPPSMTSQDEEETTGEIGLGSTSFSPTQQNQQRPNERVIHQQRVVVVPPPGQELQPNRNNNNDQRPQERRLMFPVALYPIRLLRRYIEFEFAVLRELYSRLYQEVVLRNVNGGVLFQLCFVLLVLSSRISPTSQPTKFQFLCFLIVCGFMYQIKLPHFLYTFFVKENVPFRIWNERSQQNQNQQQQPNAVGPDLPRIGLFGWRQQPRLGRINEQQQQDGGGNDNGGAGGGAGNNRWQETFFMGRIAPRYQQQEDGGEDGGNAVQAGRGNPVVGLFWDVFYLFGSFVFSIFPMWRPEHQRQRPQRPAVAADVQQQQDDVLNDNVVVGRDHHQQQQQIPQVRPPRDAMEPVEEEDDDSSSDDDDDDDDDDGSRDC
jgi:hypothetical protein